MSIFYRTPDGFNINPSVIRTQSRVMKMCEYKIYDALEAAQHRMNAMLNAMLSDKLWEIDVDAGRLIIDKFDALRPEIDEQRRVMEEFCGFLDNFLDEYEYTE